jgi:hypothetical protein
MVCELLAVFMTYVSNYKKLCEWDDTKNRGRRRWTFMQKGLCIGISNHLQKEQADDVKVHLVDFDWVGVNRQLW